LRLCRHLHWCLQLRDILLYWGYIVLHAKSAESKIPGLNATTAKTWDLLWVALRVAIQRRMIVILKEWLSDSCVNDVIYVYLCVFFTKMN
jgi:hypothetical protein